MNNKKMSNKILPITIAAIMLGSGIPSGMALQASADSPALISAPVSENTSMPSGYILNGKLIKMDRLTMPFESATGDLYLPLRKFSEALGSNVKWHQKENAIVIVANEKTYTFQVLKDKNSPSGYVLKSENGISYETTVRFGSHYVKGDFFREAFGFISVTDHLNQLRIDSKLYAPDEASTLGEITELTQGKDGIQVLVRGQKYGSFGYNEISIAVKRDTPVRKSNGEVVSLSDLKVGDSLYIQYSKAVTRSIPPMGQGLKVVLLEDESVFEGKVYFKQLSVEKYPGAGSIAAPIKQLRVIGTADYLLHIDDKTMIVDQKNKAVDFDQLKEGSIVQVFTAPYAAMSYPAQTTAYRIVVISLAK